MQRLPGISWRRRGPGGVLHGLGPLRGVIGGRWRGTEAEPRGEDDHDGRGHGGGEAPGGPAAAIQRFVVLDQHDDPPVEVRAAVADSQRGDGRGRTCGPARGGRGTRRNPRPSPRRRPGRRPGNPGRGEAAASATRTGVDRRGRAPQGRRGSRSRRRAAPRATTRAPGRSGGRRARSRRRALEGSRITGRRQV